MHRRADSSLDTFPYEKNHPYADHGINAQTSEDGYSYWSRTPAVFGFRLDVGIEFVGYAEALWQSVRSGQFELHLRNLYSCGRSLSTVILCS
jgi:hypothetical protein